MVRRVLERAESVKDTAETFGVSRQTIYKWLRRYREEGLAELEDRSSRRQPLRARPAGNVYPAPIRLELAGHPHDLFDLIEGSATV